MQQHTHHAAGSQRVEVGRFEVGVFPANVAEAEVIRQRNDEVGLRLLVFGRTCHHTSGGAADQDGSPQHDS